MTAPKSLIINSPYDPPSQHWEQARDGTLAMIPKRRPAGYEIFDVRNNTRRTEELKAVNEIRQRVDAWREADYPGITSITRKLLELKRLTMLPVIALVGRANRRFSIA